MSSAAVAAAAMAALTASQAPGVHLAQPGGDDDGPPAGSLPDLPPGDDSYHTELPPLKTPAPPEDGTDAPGVVGDQSGIPATVLAAYKKAERSLGASDPGCNLEWELLAAIGKVESGQARGGAVDEAGTTLSPIRGPQLNGEGFARIEDTDGGVYDGDTRFDRAVGPMQFIPSTWATWGADGNGDGRKDPDNVFDAALAAGAYLCHGERDLAVKAHLDRAILSYNNSRDYLNTVLAWLAYYRDGVHTVPDGTGVLPTSPGAGDSDTGAGDGTNPPNGAGGGDGRGQGDGSGGESEEPGPGESDDPSGEPTDPPSGDPTDPPTGDPTDPPTGDPTDPAPEVPAQLVAVENGPVTTLTRATVTEGLDVRVLSEDGDVVAGADVRFAVTGEDGTEGAAFADGSAAGTVTTDENGVAAAPDLRAGQHAGTLTVRATVVGHETVAAATVEVTVEGTTLQRAGDGGTTVTAEAGQICQSIRIAATHGGTAADGVPVTATVLAADGTEPDAGTGPYFQDPSTGEPTHERKALTTGPDGTLVLPDLYAGSQGGTYRLRLTTADGGVLVLDIEVEEPATEPTASPEPTPSS